MALPPLPHDEQRELVRRWQENEDYAAREMLVRSTLGLVAKFLGERPWVPFDEGCQNMCIELMVAMDKFDLSRDVAFTSYARWRLLKAVTDTEIDDKIVRLPGTVIKAQRKRRKELNAAIDSGMSRLQAELAIYDHYLHALTQEQEIGAVEPTPPEEEPPTDISPYLQYIRIPMHRMIVRFVVGSFGGILWSYVALGRIMGVSKQRVEQQVLIAKNDIKRSVSR